MIPKEILRKVRKIEITTRGLVNEVFSGQYHSVFKGRGMDFAEVREYQFGDEVRSIDWNVSARTGSPFVKVYQEERELNVILLVDASASGDFGTHQRMKGEIGVEICALLAFSAIKNNDKVGLIIFTDTVEKFVPPRKGRKHVLRVIRELLYFRPQRRGTDLALALDYLNRVTKRRSVVFFTSDFLGPNFSRPLRISSRRHDLIALRLSDPREHLLPNIGLIELEDGESNQRWLVDTTDRSFRERYQKQCQQRLEEQSALFQSVGVDCIDIRTDLPYTKPLLSFFRKRARRFR